MRFEEGLKSERSRPLEGTHANQVEERNEWQAGGSSELKCLTHSTRVVVLEEVKMEMARLMDEIDGW